MALGVVIDDAVVGAENVARRLREQREAGSDASIAQIVIEAAQEMRSPLGYATLIALLAVVPVSSWKGGPGAFFEPLALAYALAVAGGDGGRADPHAGAQPAALLAAARRAARESPLVRRGCGRATTAALARVVAQAARRRWSPRRVRGSPRLAVIAAARTRR